MRKFIILLFALFFIFVPKVEAVDKNTFVTVVNPVKGPEGWSNKFLDPLQIPVMEYNASTVSAIPVTWLLRYDAVNDASISAYFKKISDGNNTQTLGALLEITPKLAQKANIDGRFPVSNLLTSYYPEQRKALIDAFMQSFQKRFGYLPQSVGAQYIDSYSLEYLQKRYSVMVATIDDESFSAGDHLWGGYAGSVYLPSKTNALEPGSFSNNRIDIVITRWKQNDLFSYYNGKTNRLSFPDIAFVDKVLRQYSQKDFNEFTNISFGLENDFGRPIFSQDIKNTYKWIANLKISLGLQFVSLQTLGNFVLNRYPESSPAYFYRFTDPTGESSDTLYWYQNAYYRIGLRSSGNVTKLVDLHIFDSRLYEDFFATPNISSEMSLELPSTVDLIKNPGSETGIDIDLSKAKIDYQNWRVTFTDGNKKIELDPQSVVFTNINPSISSLDITPVKNNDQTVWNFTPHLPFDPQIDHLWFLFAIFIPLIIVSFFLNRTIFFGLIFALLTTFTVIRSGSLYPFGLGIWGPNGHDAIFHISLISKFANAPFNLDHPQLSGALLSNYHFVFDYLSAFVSRIFALSPITVYFVIYPIVSALAMVFLLAALFKRWKLSSLESVLAFFFVFLSGSLGFIPAMITGQNPLYGESVFWANQSVSILLNPPFALSIIVTLIFLLLIDRLKKPNFIQILLIGLVGGLLAQTKIYAFILVCAALLFNKRFKELISVGIIGVLLTLPFTSVSGSPFLLSPLWFVKSMFASPDRIWWPKLVQAWQTYEANGIWLKLFAISLFALIVFLVGNLATRLISLKYVLSKRTLSTTEKIALIISLFGILIPLVIIQNINPWNTIQFIYYSLFFLGIFTARGLVICLNKINSRPVKIFLALLVLIISAITSIGTLQDYLGYYSSSRVSYSELYGLEKLSLEPKGIVLSPLFSESLAGGVPTPKPLYSYVSTAYISAFSGQPEYLSDTINLDITGYNYAEKSRDQQRFYQTDNKDWALQFLKTSNISYVYETPLQKIKLNPAELCLTKIFDSQEINIYKFNCHVQN